MTTGLVPTDHKDAMRQINRKPFVNVSPLISTDLYISLEIKRWILHNETPGKFGYFTADKAGS
jgi:hypothetical protein